MSIKIRMYPHLTELGGGESGINTVVRKYFQHLPNYDIELIEPDANSYDLRAAHAGITGADTDVCHTHGLYWTGDYNASDWEWHVNSRVIAACRSVKIITVPSDWVAETFRRDMRLNPVIIPHGVDWQEWQHSEECRGYVLWAKNRTGDVCDNSILDVLMARFKDVDFVSTLETPQTKGTINTPVWPKNFKLLPGGGKTPHNEMRGFIQRAGVYLSSSKETFGISVLEAMASGVPVLGYDWGGNSFLVKHGVSGYLAKPNDIDDLCEGLIYCLKHRKVLGANARELTKAWTWETACEKVAGVYRLAMEEQPVTVSVVIPVFNKPKEQVERAVASCLTQTLKPQEIIVVDDGSNEDYAWVESMGGPVKYVKQSNAGVAIARNNGISRTNSKYITCLDSDDWLEPTFLEVCVKALESDRGLGIAYTGLMTHSADGSSTVSQWPGQFDANKQLSYPKQNQIPTANVFRREAWERVGGYKSRYCPAGAGSEDAALWSAICSVGYGAIKATDEPLFNYTAHGGNVHANRDYAEIDWLSMSPWAVDGLHPFASVATPKKWSHPVRQYDQPLISVIIPVGPAHEKEVMNALDSLEMQTFRKWEAVVINDTDNDLDKMFKAYPYVKWVNTSGRRGAGVARNMGATAARAPLLFFLDADDVLAYPDALQKMLDAWNSEQAIIYTDYLGKAIWDYEKAKRKMGANLLDYNSKTGAVVFKKQSQDFDCELAIQQPLQQAGEAMPFYHWSLISVLIPKAWHNKVGGFNEDMETWEDVLYHWKLARAGYCYHRVVEPLILYNYHKGFRREASQVKDAEGRQKYKNMLSYITEVLKDFEPMGCNCGGKRKTLIPTITAEQAAEMSDGVFVMIEFDFPGSDTRSNYGKALMSLSRQVGPDGKILDYKGYGRQKGDRFLVHIKDQQMRPDMFRLVQAEVALPEVEKVVLPEPELIVAKPKRRGRPKTTL